MKTKLIIFLPLLLAVVPLFAQEQIRADLNMLRVNDVIVKQQVEYKDLEGTGTNILWDFGDLKKLDDKYTLTYSNIGDSIIAGTEHQTRYYYELKNDSLLLHGYENPTTKIIYDVPELLMHYPMKLGDKVDCYFKGRGTYCDKLDIEAYGFSELTIDAEGMIILPSEDTLKHVVRTHTTKLISEKIIPMIPDTATNTPIDSLKQYKLSTKSIEHSLQTDSAVLITDTYRWYAAGYRYPVFETVLTRDYSHHSQPEYFATAFFFPPQEHSYLESDEDNNLMQTALQKKENDKNSILDIREIKFTYNYYPNPVGNQLNYQYLLSEGANVSCALYSLSGSTLYRTPAKKHSAGTYSNVIDMSSYHKGIYIFSIIVNDKMYSEKIIKK